MPANKSLKSKSKSAARKSTKVETKVIAPAMTVTFNRMPFTLDEARIVELVKAHEARKPAPNGAALIHKVSLPSLQWPTSLQWAIEALTGIPAQGISRNGGIKGSYHPQQAMALLSKLSPFGVKVETLSANPRYGDFGPRAFEAREALKAQLAQAQQAFIAQQAQQALERQQAQEAAERAAQRAARKAEEDARKAALEEARKFNKRHQNARKSASKSKSK